MLNFGCGSRIADGWINIDFSSSDSRVRTVNLLTGFPFSANEFDVVYSSHVLEHFTKEQARMVLQEAYRVLKPNGILRMVVPDLEATCREYLRILALPDSDDDKHKLYEWIMIELLDQLVRSEPGGEMAKMYQSLSGANDKKMQDYVISRTENLRQSELLQKLNIDARKKPPVLQRIRARLLNSHLKAIRGLLPGNIRSMVFVETAIGERHRWMYDTYGLKMLIEQSGFVNCQAMGYSDSRINNFKSMLLDTNSDGSSYKNVSIYMEAIKPEHSKAVG